MNENRDPRRRLLKPGSIVFGGAGIDCTVRNISATGAALDVASPVGIPKTFTLVVGGFLRRQCDVEWRKPRRIGVKFAKR
jgi:PilZ domain-containing protein